MNKWLLGFCIFLTACVTSAPEEAQTPSSPSAPPVQRMIPVPGGEQTKVKWLENVVLIKQGQGAGSGFFIKSSYQNFVVSAAHVSRNLVEQESTVTTYAGTTYKVTNTVESDITDAALVYIDGVAAPDGLSVECREADFQEQVFIAGHPFGIDQEVLTSGKVASTKRIVHPQIPGIQGILLDARVSPGNSGGPVLDSDGDVVGILVAAVPGGGVAIMVPIIDVCDELGLK